MLSTRTLRRHPARAGAGLLAVATVVLLGLQRPALAAPVTSAPAEAAAGWLTTQRVDGYHTVITIGLTCDRVLTTDGRLPDYGLTADTVIALAAAGVGLDYSTAAMDYLETNVELYVGDADRVGDADGEFYAGALAKTLLAADVTGRDPATFGEVDVLSRLLSTEQPSGRFSDISAFGDFSNNIGQSFAVLALARVDPSALSPAAAGFLAGQQCVDGGALNGNVPLTIGADPCAAESSSIDTTSFAVQALLAVGDSDSAAAGLSYLGRSQGAEGSFSDLGVENSNSTGLAAQTLRVGGLDAPADAAVDWLVARQLDCSAPPEQQGAIAYTDGPDGSPLYDDRATRATTQAAPGIAGVGLSDVAAAGSTAAAPRLDCGAPTSTATPTPTPTSAPTSSPTAPPTLTSSPTPSAPGTTAGPTSSRPGLPNTGADIAPLLGVGGFSLAIGVGLLAASRRRSGLHR